MQTLVVPIGARRRRNDAATDKILDEAFVLYAGASALAPVQVILSLRVGDP
jgi:hypothetical protein